MKKLLATAALLLVATAAQASTWYVRPAARGGDDALAGDDSTRAWATVAHGIAVAEPGDVVKILGGTYAEGLATVRAGAASNYITFLGDCATPGNVNLSGNAGCDVMYSYVSVRGINFCGTGSSSGLDIDHAAVAPFAAALYDSVSWCTFLPTDTLGSLAISPGRTNNATHCGNVVIYGNTFVIRDVWADVVGGYGYNAHDAALDIDPVTHLGHAPGDSARTRGVTLRCNSISAYKGGSAGIWEWRGVQQSTIDTNVVHLVWQAGPTFGDAFGYNGASGWKKDYFASRNHYRDNHWYIDDRRGGTSGTSFYVYQRDSSHFNTWARDTFDVNTQAINFNLSTAGNNVSSGTEGNCSWTSCIWRNRFGNGPQWQAGMQSDSLIGCMIATVGKPLFWTNKIYGDNVIDHCTFADSASGAWSVAPGAFPWTGTFKLTSNIFYSKDKLGTDHSALRFKLPRGNPLYSDYNYYVMWDSTAVFGDRSIGYTTCEANGTLESALIYSRPDSIPWRLVNSGLSGVNLNNDIHSRVNGRAKGTAELVVSGKAGLKFTDSLIVSFTGRIQSGSGALTVGAGGSDAGAYQLTTADATRPDDPQDMYVLGPPRPDIGAGGGQTVTLEFTATGDDSVTGTAHHYEVRYSTATITSGTFDTDQVFQTAQVPLVAGSIDRIYVTGLLPTTDYYFAIKVVDEANNKSAVSNVVTVRTLGAGGGTSFTEP